ncbi:hypothetical protein N8972_00285 [Sulfurospirillum sp.]|nr:hypothetical protein [Sulfurospirillum sp.]
MKVGVAQIEIKLFDIKANIKKHLLYIKKAKELNIDILVFPELSLSGYHIKDKVLEMAMSINCEAIETIIHASSGMRIMFGFAELSRNAVIYNSLMSANDGNIELVYRKNNLPNYGKFIEKAIFSAGREVQSIQIDNQWQYASLICADMWDPSLIHKTMIEGTNFLITSFNGGVTKENITNIENWKRCFDFYSMMYGSYIVGANRVGIEGEFQFFGGSVIMDPHGNIVAKAKEFEEDLIYAIIDYRQVELARTYAPNIKNLI